jgi:hypothetical protein
MTRILDLCGGTGSWSQPYTDAGYDVLIVDPVVNGRDARLLERERGVRGVLAAPVCTVWSYARNRYPASQAEMMASLSLVDACIRIAWVHMQRGAQWWALENPRNKLRRFLGPARLEFYQWEYGDAGHKPTCRARIAHRKRMHGPRMQSHRQGLRGRFMRRTNEGL